MSFQILCLALAALIFGALVCFAGYRLFIVLLPFWGFFVGFALGAGALAQLFGHGFLSTVTSWVAGFVVGLIFAALAYLFYVIGVAIFAGSFGYALGAGLMYAIGFDPGFLSWLIGIVVAVIVALLTLLLNIQKWVIILISAFSGAAAIIGGFLLMFNRISLEALGMNPVREVIQGSLIWLLIFLALGVIGFIAQTRTTSGFTVEPPANKV